MYADPHSMKAGQMDAIETAKRDTEAFTPLQAAQSGAEQELEALRMEIETLSERLRPILSDRTEAYVEPDRDGPVPVDDRAPATRAVSALGEGVRTQRARIRSLIERLDI